MGDVVVLGAERDGYAVEVDHDVAVTCVALHEGGLARARWPGHDMKHGHLPERGFGPARADTKKATHSDGLVRHWL